MYIICMLQTNVQRYHQLNASFRLLGFHDDEVDTVYCILAAILHLGDLEFGEVVTQDNTDNKSRVIDLAPLHRGGLTCFMGLQCLGNESVIQKALILTNI
jgi:myosin-3